MPGGRDPESLLRLERRDRLREAAVIQRTEPENGQYVITGRNEVVAKVMFLLVSVILLTGGVCLSACWDTTPPTRHLATLGADTPRPGSRPPQSRHLPGAATPPREADSGIRSMSGRYASYWNAFLLEFNSSHILLLVRDELILLPDTLIFSLLAIGY